jgi:hypothetical protein
VSIAHAQNRAAKWTTYTTGVIVIGGCVVALSAALSLFVRLWDPCSWVSIVIFGSMSLALGAWQYRGVFRKSATAARNAGALLAVIGTLLLGTFVIGNAEIAWSSGSRFLPAMPEVFVVSLAMLLAATVNVRLSQRLRREPAAPTGPRWRFSLFDALAALTVIAGVSACTAAMVRQIHPRCAEHVSASRVPTQLPADATDVSYCQGSRGTFACEFRCSEQAFREWIEGGIGSIESQAANIAIEEITAPISVRRFTVLQPNATGPETATITAGLEYAWSKEDRGVDAVFDRLHRRGYLFEHSH